jgi:2-methylcitrate dehydratase PrpD
MDKPETWSGSGPPVDFILNLKFSDIPEQTIQFARRCLLDLIGVAAAGISTPLSIAIRKHAVTQLMAETGGVSMLFDSRQVSPMGAALAGGMTIDSMDAHDGHKLTKGHVGCGVLPGLLAFTQAEKRYDDREFLTSLVIGYEMGVRAGIALHTTVEDYHTSGAWVSVAVAALGARALRLNSQQTREALGIAEYHGPRSQMMRVIDAPTMVKDGSGWGAMAGVSAAYLAADGFTGAPAITVEGENVASFWTDLGQRWRIHEQYFKPYPVCRWAQPAIEAALSLCRKHDIDAGDIVLIEVATFHEARRLCTPLPENTEQAQYSLPFATAAAIVFGDLGPEQVSGEALQHAEVRRLSATLQLVEEDQFNREFPARRLARVVLLTKGGRRYESEVTEARGDPETPLDDSAIVHKFHCLAEPVLGIKRTNQIEILVQNLGAGDGLSDLISNITANIEP